MKRNLPLRHALVLCSAAAALLMSAPPLAADDAAIIEKVAEASRSYQRGMERLAEKEFEEALRHYASAAELYEQALRSGFVNGQIYYNLGNAYFRQKKVGLAILNYRRAQRLLPRDEDLRQNLVYAKQEILDEQPEQPLPEFFRAMLFWHLGTTLNGSIVIGVVFYVAVCVLTTIFIFARLRALRHTIVVLCVLLAVSLASLGWKYYQEQIVRRGVVIAATCDVRAGHDDFESLIATLHEGTEFRIEDRFETRAAAERQRWFKISVGKTRGWVLADQASAVSSAEPVAEI